jgi:Penicillin amidase
MYLSRATSTQYGSALILGGLRKIPNLDNVEDACDLMAPTEVATNFIVTDLSGRVAYQQGGCLPKRQNPFLYGVENADDANAGLLPLPAWLKTSAWEGRYPPSQHK